MKDKKIILMFSIAVACIILMNLSGCEDKEEQTVSTTLTTKAAFYVTQTTAVSGGTIISIGDSEIVSSGVVWGRSPYPTTENNSGITVDEIDSNEFVSIITGLDKGLYYLRAYATNRVETSYGDQVEFSTNGYGADITDIDGNNYVTVIIGSQEWMAENLKTTKYQNGDPIPTNLDNNAWLKTKSGTYAVYPHTMIDGLNTDAQVAASYGNLYNWYAVEDARGLCPTGWRVPTNDDWYTLRSFSNDLKILRSEPDNHPRWANNNYLFNKYGFSAVPGGYRFHEFEGIGITCLFNSRTQDSDHAYEWELVDHWEQVFQVYLSMGGKCIGRSVRCIKE